MKTMKDFAAQQLTKKQMNAVRGGEKLKANCTVTNDKGVVVDSYPVEYERGSEALLQHAVQQLTPIGCVTICVKA